MGKASRSRRSRKGTAIFVSRIQESFLIRLFAEPKAAGSGSHVSGISEPGHAAKLVHLVQALPGQVEVVAAEVAIRGDLPVERAAKLKLADEAVGAEVEHLLDVALDVGVGEARALAVRARAEGLHVDAEK